MGTTAAGPAAADGTSRRLHDVPTYQTPEWHPAFEEYCEAIFELREDDVEVIQARIAERLEVSRPAVSEMIKRMEKQGLVTIEAGAIGLTVDGLALAEQVVRRHRIAEVFLTEVLGLSWAEAHAEAGRWEHVISERVESAMLRLLDDPTTCPHGNPIPGSGYAAPDMVNLSSVSPGASFTVVRIPEELEFTPGLLDWLESSSLIPGTIGTVETTSPDGTLTVVLGDHHVGVGAFAADRILVTQG
jgi:DtxR family Mn-dependent transcriptional regulator